MKRADCHLLGIRRERINSALSDDFFLDRIQDRCSSIRWIADGLPIPPCQSVERIFQYKARGAMRILVCTRFWGNGVLPFPAGHGIGGRRERERGSAFFLFSRLGRGHKTLRALNTWDYSARVRAGAFRRKTGADKSGDFP